MLDDKLAKATPQEKTRPQMERRVGGGNDIGVLVSSLGDGLPVADRIGPQPDNLRRQRTCRVNNSIRQFDW